MREDVSEIVERLAQERKYLEGRTVLVTGSNGFLGKVFTAYLREVGCKVIAVDNYVIGTGGDAAAMDITKPVTIDDQLDYIVNTAGIASPYHYRRLPLETLDVSYLGTRNMLELAKEHQVKGFLAFSSSEVYGNPEPLYIPTPESYIGRIPTMGERSCYDEGKRVIETLCHVYHERYGVNTKIVRPFNVFGPPLFKNDYRVIPHFISCALAGKPLTVYGDGHQTRTFCYVTDFVVGAVKVLLHGDHLPYNVGNSDNEMAMSDLARLIEEVLGRKLDIRLIGYPSVYPADEPRRRCPDLTKITYQLDYRPKVSVREGVGRFYHWASQV